MRKQISMYAALVLLLPFSCDTYAQEMIEGNETLLVQAVTHSAIMTHITQHITPIVNTVNALVKEELGLDQSYDFDFVLPAEGRRFTLYYINGIGDAKGEQIILSALEQLSLEKIVLHTVLVAPRIALFGNLDSYVIYIDDVGGELLALRQKIKNGMHILNSEYKKIHNQELYDVAYSERYQFMPHMGLIKIRFKSVQKHIADNTPVETVLKRVGERALPVIKAFMQEIWLDEYAKLIVDKYAVFNVHKQVYVKEFLIP